MKDIEQFSLSQNATSFDFLAEDIVKKRELYEIYRNQIIIGYLVRDKYGNFIKEFNEKQMSEAFIFCFPKLNEEEKKNEKEYWDNFKKSQFFI